MRVEYLNNGHRGPAYSRLNVRDRVSPGSAVVELRINSSDSVVLTSTQARDLGSRLLKLAGETEPGDIIVHEK